MRKVRLLRCLAAVVAMVGVGLVTTARADAIVYGEMLNGAQQAIGNGMTTTNLQDQTTVIINILLYVVGIVAVGFIIYGGIKYATSAGDTAKVTSAKNTLMYAIIGLIVAILAYAIANFVIDRVSG